MTSATIDPGPMAPDVKAIWDLNAQAAIRRGILTPATAETFSALCFGVALDARITTGLAREQDPRKRRT